MTSSHEALSVAVAASRFPAPSQTFVLDHVRGLVEDGHDIKVISLSRADPREACLTVPKEEATAAVLYTSPHPPGTAKRFRTLRDLAQLTLRQPRMAYRAGLSYQNVGYGRGEVVRAARILGPLADLDLLHCHFGPVGATMAAAQWVLERETPIVTTFHGFDVTSVPRALGPTVYRQLFDRGTLFLAVSEHFRQRLVDMGAPRERTLVQRVGVDVRRFTPTNRPADPDGHLRVLSVARLVEKKGLAYALQGIADVVRSGVRVRYTIAGDGPLRSSLEGQVEQLGIQEYVRLIGRASRERVLSEMQLNDVFLAPSVTSEEGDQEGVPVTLMEAMATAMPVVSTRHSGIPELVEDGWNGLLADERDVAAIAIALRNLAGDRQLRAELGQNGRQTIEDGWDARRLRGTIVQRYREVVASH